jgi:putative oxidoreductase
MDAVTIGPPARARWAPFARRLRAWLEATPYSLVALLGRLGIGMTFWQSGQTKVEGLAVDPVAGQWTLGWPRLAPGTVDLFRDEYALPVLPPELAATLAATAEHVFPVLLLLGLATRASALALLGMTLVIQLFVYPLAYPTHALWATVLVLLVARGGGVVSLDHLLFGRRPR